jgi:hypothetical protein
MRKIAKRFLEDESGVTAIDTVSLQPYLESAPPSPPARLALRSANVRHGLQRNAERAKRFAAKSIPPALKLL